MQPVIVRSARKSDIPALIHLCEVLGYAVSEPHFSKRFNAITQSSDDQIFVGEMNNQVIGFVHIFIKDLLERETAAEIGGIAIDKNMQSQGVGRALIVAAETWTRQHHCQRIIVKSNIKRTLAHGFYQHLGYVINKQQIVFEKNIQQ